MAVAVVMAKEVVDEFCRMAGARRSHVKNILAKIVELRLCASEILLAAPNHDVKQTIDSMSRRPTEGRVKHANTFFCQRSGDALGRPGQRGSEVNDQ